MGWVIPLPAFQQSPNSSPAAQESFGTSQTNPGPVDIPQCQPRALPSLPRSQGPKLAFNNNISYLKKKKKSPGKQSGLGARQDSKHSPRGTRCGAFLIAGKERRDYFPLPAMCWEGRSGQPGSRQGCVVPSTEGGGYVAVGRGPSAKPRAPELINGGISFVPHVSSWRRCGISGDKRDLFVLKTSPASRPWAATLCPECPRSWHSYPSIVDASTAQRLFLQAGKPNFSSFNEVSHRSVDVFSSHP